MYIRLMGAQPQNNACVDNVTGYRCVFQLTEHVCMHICSRDLTDLSVLYLEGRSECTAMTSSYLKTNRTLSFPVPFMFYDVFKIRFICMVKKRDKLYLSGRNPSNCEIYNLRGSHHNVCQF